MEMNKKKRKKENRWENENLSAHTEKKNETFVYALRNFNDFNLNMRNMKRTEIDRKSEWERENV